METDPDIVAGAADAAVVLHVPHSSRTLTPRARARILLDDVALGAELDHLTDAHTDVIAARAATAAASTPWMFSNRLSRLVVDPERFPDEREEMRAVGMGAVYTRTSHKEPLREPDPAHEEELLAQHYRPYAMALADLVDARLAGTGRAAIIDVHSYPSRPLPYELHAAGERPAICLGTDATHTPQWLVDSATAAFAHCGTVALDTPFAGCYVPLRHYRKRPYVVSIMVEIRRDIYMTEPGGPPTDGIVAVVRALTGLVDAVTRHLAGAATANHPDK
jgi:N-formylglutamate deformylase